MKRGTFGVILLLVILIGSLLCSLMVRNQIGSLTEDLERAAQAALRKDYKETAALTEKVSTAWKKYRMKFSCLSHQDAVREIDSLFAQMEVFQSTEEAACCSAACVMLKNQLQALLEDQLPCFHSLL